MNTNIIHSLKEINHSMFIIGGAEKEDNQTILENYQHYNQAIEIEMINNTKQLPHMECPKQILEQIEIFLGK